MFGIGGVELLLIIVFAFLILGPDKLPEMAKTAGKAIARFRDARQDMDEVLKENNLVDEKTGKAITNPVDMIDRVAKVAADGKGEEVAEKVSSAAAAAAVSIIKPKDNGNEGDGTGEEAEPLSFAERKARYERERAAREAASKADAEPDEVPDQGGAEAEASAVSDSEADAAEVNADAAESEAPSDQSVDASAAAPEGGDA